jgi:hypothetical protein
MRRRAPGAAPARPACPPAADNVPVPAQDRPGSDDQPHRRQALCRHRPRNQRQPRPVRPRQPGAGPWPLALGDSELVPQHQDLGVLPPRFPPRQPHQRYYARDDQEDQLQAHKPTIIPSRVQPSSMRSGVRPSGRRIMSRQESSDHHGRPPARKPPGRRSIQALSGGSETADVTCRTRQRHRGGNVVGWCFNKLCDGAGVAMRSGEIARICDAALRLPPPSPRPVPVTGITG